jgi:hypothetical protein
MTAPSPNMRILLEISKMNDQERLAALSGIEKVGPSSPLFAIPSIAASYASLSLKGTALGNNVAAAAAAEKLYRSTVSSRDLSRDAFDLELDTLKTAVENNAATANDLTSMGFVQLIVAKASRLAPLPPAALLVRLGKAHGAARVSVAGKGYLGSFAAQMTTCPVTPTSTWTDLPGHGKQRSFSGYATGTQMAVRFAAERFGLQSDWCVPAILTIP